MSRLLPEGERRDALWLAAVLVAGRIVQAIANAAWAWASAPGAPSSPDGLVPYVVALAVMILLPLAFAEGVLRLLGGRSELGLVAVMLGWHAVSLTAGRLGEALGGWVANLTGRAEGWSSGTGPAGLVPALAVLAVVAVRLWVHGGRSGESEGVLRVLGFDGEGTKRQRLAWWAAVTWSLVELVALPIGLVQTVAVRLSSPMAADPPRVDLLFYALNVLGPLVLPTVLYIAVRRGAPRSSWLPFVAWGMAWWVIATPYSFIWSARYSADALVATLGVTLVGIVAGAGLPIVAVLLATLPSSDDDDDETGDVLAEA